MKIIFLDIDGVLCLPPKWHKNEEAFSKQCCKNLTRIVKETGAKIVVSSSWRLHEDNWKLMLKILRKNKFDVKCIIGKTDIVRISSNRGQEIEAWLSNNFNIKSFVILDDEVFDMIHLSKNIVHCNPEVGLTEADADKAIQILNKS